VVGGKRLVPRLRISCLPECTRAPSRYTYTRYTPGVQITFEEPRGREREIPRERERSQGGRGLSADVFMSSRAPRVRGGGVRVGACPGFSLSLSLGRASPRKSANDRSRVRAMLRAFYSQRWPLVALASLAGLCHSSAFGCSIHRVKGKLGKNMSKKRVWVHGRVEPANLDESLD